MAAVVEIAAVREDVLGGPVEVYDAVLATHKQYGCPNPGAHPIIMWLVREKLTAALSAVPDPLLAHMLDVHTMCHTLHPGVFDAAKAKAFVDVSAKQIPITVPEHLAAIPWPVSADPTGVVFEDLLRMPVEVYDSILTAYKRVNCLPTMRASSITALVRALVDTPDLHVIPDPWLADVLDFISMHVHCGTAFQLLDVKDYIGRRAFNALHRMCE